MYAIDFVDRTFSKDLSGTYDLSIQANQHGLAYCIFDRSANIFIVFRKQSFEHLRLQEDLTSQIVNILQKDNTLDLSFHSVRFLGYTRHSTLVPDAFYDRSSMHEYLSFNLSDDADRELFSNHIAPPGLYNVFALRRDLVSVITLHFKKVEFLSQTTSFLRHIVSGQDALATPAVHIGLNTVFFDMACTGNGGLKHYNTFQYESENDLLYYVLYIYKQLGFDTRQVPLYISGELSSKLSYYEILRQYISNTAYAAPQKIPALASGLQQLNLVKFLNLLNIQTCALSAEHTGAEK